MAKISQNNQQLQEIISPINHYLYHFRRHWLFMKIGKSYYKKCRHSWSYVSRHLENFLSDPNNNYALLITILDLEKKKFPPHSFYGKKLIELEQFIVSGPKLK